ncbi:MAG: Hsp20/alpha crystallin family protein [Nitrospinota bacterium]|nr:MAG: Hsp20/alpha crystallin family protein [Nitrospinota bacterium]
MGMLPTMWRPLSEEIRSLQRTVDDLFNRFFAPVEGTWSRTFSPAQSAWYPRLEAYTEDGTMHVNVLIPGVDPEHVQVSVAGNQLTIKGERPWDEKAAQSRNYFFQEIPYGQFERTIILPENVDADKVHAKFHHGILEITLPASAAIAPKKIEIEAGEAAWK